MDQPDPSAAITVTAHSVTLDVTGQPDVKNKYGSGHIRPRIVRVDYQDNAIHAQVYGSWIRESGELTDAPCDQDYLAHTGDVRDWPDWLAAVAILARGAAAPAVVSPPQDRAALRDRIADTLYPTYGQEDRNRSLAIADAVLAVLPEPTSRAAAAQQQPAAGLPLVKGNCPACQRASLFLGTGGYPTCSNPDCTEPDAATTVLEQYANEAHAPEHTWAAELHDPDADEWVPSIRYAVRDRAVTALEHGRRIGPTWKDGTPTRRRLVRATTTYTVEEPASSPQQPAPTREV